MSKDSTVTATVNPSEASASTTVDTGFAEPDGTPAAVQQFAPTVVAVADPGQPEDPGADLEARVAGRLAKKLTTDWNAVQDFMNAVVPWPASPSNTGWINLHWSYPDKNSKATPPPNVLRGGKPYKEIADFIKDVAWRLQHPENYKDMFFCTSKQRDTKLDRNGRVRAAKSAPAALALKSIWVDIDVGPDEVDKAGKVTKAHYHSEVEALKAILRFASKVGLPTPSAIVRSGGGLHVYWISTEALTRKDWLPYAQGLKNLLNANTVLADTPVTTDAARILRIPGTLNHKPKYPQPMPVELIDILLNTYDFSSKLAFLHQFAGPAVAPTAAPAQHSIWADDPTVSPGARDSFKDGPAPGFNNPEFRSEPGLEAGFNKQEEFKVDYRPIFKKCGFYRDALLTGGKGHGQPLWNLAVLGATFMEKGDDIAHRISHMHAGYTKDPTQALYDRKLAERAASGTLGYPSCAAFAGAGSASCQKCPLFPQGKSPLNIRPDAPEFTAAGNTADGDAAQANPSFVDPYAEFVGPEFPLDILPATLAAFVDAEHRAMGADPAAIAMAALTAVAGAMNSETRVRMADGWWEKPILWTVLVGQPSSMKSPILDKVNKPLSDIDHERSKRFSQAHKQWLQDKKIDKTIVGPVKQPRCLINDATPEKVAEILSRDPSGSLMVHDELAGWLGSFERYNSGSSRSFFLSCWNGGTFTKDRVGNGSQDADAEICVDNLALGILGGIQPDLLGKLGDLTSDGLLQRFLIVLMKRAERGNQDYPLTEIEAEYEKLIRSINGSPAQNYHFADDALKVRDRVLDYLHMLELVDGFPTSLIGAIGKLKGYFARVCLVLHIARRHDVTIQTARELNPSFPRAAGERLSRLLGVTLDDSLSAGINGSSAISRETAQMAERLVREFLLPNCFGFYDVVANGGQEREKLRSIGDFILACNKTRLRPSDFTAGVHALRGEPEQKIRDWVGRFCGMDWLVAEEGRSGAPAKAWLVVSGLREHFAERRKQAQAARAEAHAILKAGGSRGRRKDNSDKSAGGKGAPI
jgi:hypothetical protein